MTSQAVQSLVLFWGCTAVGNFEAVKASHAAPISSRRDVLKTRTRVLTRSPSKIKWKISQVSVSARRDFFRLTLGKTGKRAVLGASAG